MNPDETEHAEPQLPQSAPQEVRPEIGGLPQANVKAEVAAVLTGPETRVQEMFRDPSRTFLIVEDDPRAAGKIAIDLRIKRATKDQQADSGVISVASIEGASTAIDSLIKEGGPSKITVILDLEFPFKDDGPPDPGAGYKVLEDITAKIKGWNEAHPDKPVVLEIVMNSSQVRNFEQAKKFGAIAFSAKKDQAAEAVADYFKSQLS